MLISKVLLNFNLLQDEIWKIQTFNENGLEVLKKTCPSQYKQWNENRKNTFIIFSEIRVQQSMRDYENTAYFRLY